MNGTIHRKLLPFILAAAILGLAASHAPAAGNAEKKAPPVVKAEKNGENKAASGPRTVSVEAVGDNSYSFSFDTGGPAIISAYLVDSSDRDDEPARLFEIFKNRFVAPESDAKVKAALGEAFSKYAIAVRRESGGREEIDHKKAEKYSICFEITPAVYSESRKIGMQGRSSGLLSSPRGVACDIDGNVIVADCGNDRIQKFDGKGHFLFEFGSFAWDEKSTSANNVGTSNAATFNEPVGVAATVKNIFVSERGNNRIQKFDRDGNFLLIFGGEGRLHGKLSAPGGIACDSSNYVWVCDTKNDRVQKFDQNGNFMLEIGGFGSGSGKFNEPVDVAIDSKNNIYVLDARNLRVVSCDEYGNVRSEISLSQVPGIREASGLGVLLDGMVLVACSLDKGSRLASFSAQGKFLGFVGGEHERLSSVTVSRDGEIFASDGGAHCVVVLSPAKTPERHYMRITELLK